MKLSAILVLLFVTVLALPAHANQASPALPQATESSAEDILAKAEILTTHDLPDQERKAVMRDSIASAVRAWLQQEYSEAVSLFRAHVAAYPDSPWRAEALVHLGFDALNNLRFTEAEEAFTSVIRENRTRDSRGARILTNRAKLGLGNVKVNQHNLNSAKSILRPVSGSSCRRAGRLQPERAV